MSVLSVLLAAASAISVFAAVTTAFSGEATDCAIFTSIAVWAGLISIITAGDS